MSRRPMAWVIFVSFLALVAVSAGSEVANRAIQCGIWGFWLLFAAMFVWAYARVRSPAERERLIDTRGVGLLPQPLRRWLFDE